MLHILDAQKVFSCLLSLNLLFTLSTQCTVSGRAGNCLISIITGAYERLEEAEGRSVKLTVGVWCHVAYMEGQYI